MRVVAAEVRIHQAVSYNSGVLGRNARGLEECLGKPREGLGGKYGHGATIRGRGGGSLQMVYKRTGESQEVASWIGFFRDDRQGADPSR
jgi:hypothetical protein